MRNSIARHWTKIGVVAVWMVVCAAPLETMSAATPAPVAKPTPPPPVKPPELPKSLFTRGGKDPFFPDSARTPQPVKAEGVAAQVVVKRNPYEYLRITGMIRSRRPVVSFNTVSMAKGDRGVEVQVVMPGADNVPRPAKLRVSCIDIGDNWALVQVEGEPTPQRIYFKE